MDTTTVSVLTEVLVNILLGSFSVLISCWVIVGVQTLVNDHKREKREAESAKRDLEYHEQRMKILEK